MPFLSRNTKLKLPFSQAKFKTDSSFTYSKNSTQESSPDPRILKGKDDNMSLSESEDKSDLSFRMNEPAIKDAYANFLNRLSQSSANSTAKTRNEICSTPAVSEGITSFEANINELEKDVLNSSLSQELLNRKDVKDAYKKHCKDVTTNKELDFMKNFKPTKKRQKSIKIWDSFIFEQEKSNFKVANNKKNNDSKKMGKIIAENKLAVKKCKTSKEIKKKSRINRQLKEIETLSHEDELKEEMSIYKIMTQLHESRNVGLYVLCDNCNKMRYLPDVKDPLDLPEKWYCHMNPDGKHNDCSDPEEAPGEDEEFLINNLYNAGSIVWARVEGFPWWPAMIEDDPDLEQYFWLEEKSDYPTQYHVTFFDEKRVTRAWLRPSAIKPFKINLENLLYQPAITSKYYHRIKIAKKQAEDSLNLPLLDRLKKYSFIKRYSEKTLKRKFGGKSKNNFNKTRVNENADIKRKQDKKSKTEKESVNTNNCDFEKKNRKKFQRIRTCSSEGDSNDNISIILEDLYWQKTADNFELEFLNNLKM